MKLCACTNTIAIIIAQPKMIFRIQNSSSKITYVKVINHNSECALRGRLKLLSCIMSIYIYRLYIHSSDCVKIVFYVCFALHLFHLFITALPFLESLFALVVFLPSILHWFSSLNVIFPLTSKCDYMTFKTYRFLPHNSYRRATSTSLAFMPSSYVHASQLTTTIYLI